MLRFVFALGLALVLAAPQAQAQDYGQPYGSSYDGLSAGPRTAAPSTGVRLGIGVGPSFYFGPDVLAGTSLRDNVVATNVGVTAELTVPFTPQLYGRLMGGLLNIGADDNRADVTGSRGGVPDARYNPYLTSETILAEGNLLYYLTPPATSAVSPYVFSGLSGLFATGDAVNGINRSALAIPVGLGVEVRATRNLSFFAEGSYRFGLTRVADDNVAATANASMGDPHCDAYPEKPECKPPTCDEEPNNPECKPVSCHEDPTQPSCPGTGSDGDAAGRSRFNSGLILGGLRLGFNPAPRAIVPPPYIPPPVVVQPPLVVEPPPVRAVCDLVELNTIYFDYGSATLTPRARALLAENVELLLANPECCVFVDSYLDHAEQDRFGMPVGGRRAQAVYDYYLSRGVEAGRLQIRNRGVAEPNCDKEDPGPGCERNRRVESIPVDCERFRFLLENPSYYGPN
jgi:outer membrane protein OmpA-like peptidoglycan-associated protein